MIEVARIIVMSFLLVFTQTYCCFARDYSWYPNNKFKKLSNPQRKYFYPIDPVIKTLKIKPGMSILDIGAGAGHYTFPFAEELNGTGKIFATDVDPAMIEYIEKKVRQGKYKNIFPVLVKREGLDPFYKKHSYDIIFLSAVYHHIWHPEDYFRELRPSLKKGGRVYILHLKYDYGFYEIMFRNFRKVIETFVSKGEKFPVFQRLAKENQHFIRDWQHDEIPAEIRAKIVQDFNNMLSDKLLYNDLLDYYFIEEEKKLKYLTNVILDAGDIQLARWLVIQLSANGGFEERKNLGETNKKQLRKLNKLLLSGIFNLGKFRGATICTDIIVEKNTVISTLEAAGYRFVQEYNLHPPHHLLGFEKKSKHYANN